MGLLMHGVRRIYLDTNVFIAAFERKDVLGRQLGELFTIRPNAEPRVFVTSELTLSELLVIPYRNSDEQLADAYEDLIATNEWLQVTAVTRLVLTRAAWLRSCKPSIKLPDAIHISAALEADCTHILTADLGLADLKLPPDRFLTILRPDEQTLTDLLESLAR
jgi:predicted nucleic acid-binding protein